MKRTLAADAASEIGNKISLQGWVNGRRDHGNLIFIDLRDHTGLLQITINPEIVIKESFELAQKLRDEFVIEVSGELRPRSADLVNPKIPTGSVELMAEHIKIISTSKALPFPVGTEENVNEELRLKYRYLDLRRPKLQKYLLERSKLVKYIRNFMDDHGFWEITTPILANSSPEGARDFLVPSRLHPGKFYALPQAPQQFKQLLMVGGIPRYYQIAPCFRDEDPRADRSPGEFYQLDMEMAFASQEDVWLIMEELMKDITEKFSQKKVQEFPFPKLTYREAMDTYGSDKPDLRYEMKLQDISSIVAQSEFAVFSSAIAEGGNVKAIVAKGAATFSRSQIDDLTEMAKQEGAKGLAYIVLANGEVKSPIAKFLGDEVLKQIIAQLKAEDGDTVFFAADKRDAANKVLGKIRSVLAEWLNLKDKNVMAWAWVYDFPMYSYSEIEKRLDFEHNPFSMPVGGLQALNEQEPENIIGHQYDLIGNGYELSSGAVRNADPQTMYRAFEIAGYTKDDVDKKFGHMIEAFSYGAPPHAGNAPGLDRIFMVLKDEPNIREIIAFPKNGKAEDLMLGAPSEVTDKQLKEVHIKLDKLKK